MNVVLSVVDVFMLCSPARLMASSSSFSVVVVVVVALSPCTSRGPARLIGCVLPHVSAPEFSGSLFSSKTKKKEKKGGVWGGTPHSQALFLFQPRTRRIHMFTLT